jgi:hypothetical protein
MLRTSTDVRFVPKAAFNIPYATGRRTTGRRTFAALHTHR